jgi:uncharacterized protein (UPF0179 family)
MVACFLIPLIVTVEEDKFVIVISANPLIEGANIIAGNPAIGSDTCSSNAIY